ncbi:hypothetical protein HYW82_00910 [Candidatus Peregrinibacteria bacterium]|nr:hypothetical protein [Candidatus Peregrinibacteria bacterium]
MSNDQTEIKKAYVNLMALKQNLPQKHDLEEKYANMFNAELDRLIKFGFEIEDFKIPSQEVRCIVTGGNYASGKTYYSNEKYVEKHIFLMKLDAVLSYFAISNPETTIGFKLD